MSILLEKLYKEPDLLWRIEKKDAIWRYIEESHCIKMIKRMTLR